MIIRLTLAESDYTHYLEVFCEGLRDRMFHHSTYPDIIEPKSECDFNNRQEFLTAYMEYYKKCDDMDKIRKKLINPNNRYKKGTKAYKDICNEVLRLWAIFADNHSLKEIPLVSIQHCLEEGDENGEVVYYFSAYNKYITK